MPPPAAAGPCAIVENGTPAPKTVGVAARPREPRGRHRLPQGHDGRAHRHYAVATANPLATQAACEVLSDGGTAADALVTAQAVLGLGRAAVLRHRRRRVPALLRRRSPARSRPTTAARSRPPRDGELPALDLRHRPHRAQARCAGIGPVHRGARHPADAARRPRRARQDRLARPVHPRRHARRRRLRHQPAAGGRDRRRRAAAEASTAKPRPTSSIPTAAPRPPGPADQPGVRKDVGRHRIRPAVVLHRRYRRATSSPRRPTPRAAAPRA